MLSHEIAELRDKILQLKSMVLEHAGCGCGHMDEYIKHAASGLVNNASPLSASARGSTLASLISCAPSLYQPIPYWPGFESRCEVV